jgi:hypothetical protein
MAGTSVRPRPPLSVPLPHVKTPNGSVPLRRARRWAEIQKRKSPAVTNCRGGA